MGTERLNADIKTRLPRELKEVLERIAARRHLDLSDICREAFREYIEAWNRRNNQHEAPPAYISDTH